MAPVTCSSVGSHLISKMYVFLGFSRNVIDSLGLTLNRDSHWSELSGHRSENVQFYVIGAKCDAKIISID